MNQKQQDNAQTIQDAKKLMDMVAMPGWKDIFEDYLKGEINKFKDRILEEDYDELLVLKVNQQTLKNYQALLDYVYNKIKEGNELLKDEYAKIANEAAVRQ